MPLKSVYSFDSLDAVVGRWTASPSPVVSSGAKELGEVRASCSGRVVVE